MKKLLLLLSLIPFSSFSQVIPIGCVANAAAVTKSAMTHLWYDPFLNSVTYCNIGCNLPQPSIVYYYSTSGGGIWTTQRTLFDSTLNPLRSAQGVIYNPLSNSNPLNSFATCFGEAANNSYGVGTEQIGTTILNQHSTPNTAIEVPTSMQVIKDSGTIWVNTIPCSIVDTTYSDMLNLYKGTFNSTAKDFFYNKTTISAPVDTDVSGNKLFLTSTMVWNDN